MLVDVPLPTDLPLAAGAPTALGLLLKRVAQQDREAFSQLYDETASRFYGLALRLLRNPALAEEAVQETYLAIWQKAHTCDEARGSVLSWMLTICHRRCVDRIRQEEKRRERDLAFVQDETGVEDDFASRVAEVAAAKEVHQALDQLTPKQSEVVRTVYFDGLTVAEAADELSIPLGTAKTRLRDGLQNLRKKIGGKRHV